MPTLLAESYFHTLDPFAIEIAPGHGVRWYGLAYAAGFLVAWIFLRWAARTGRSRLSVTDAGDLMFYLIAGVLVGGRIGHALFYSHGAPFLEFSDRFPWWEVLAINRGGMSSHGGMIGFIVACWIFARRRGIPLLHLLDLGAVACTAGLFFGRLANFVNAELWGRALPPSMQDDPPAWSVKYPDEVLTPAFAHATEVYERLRGVVDDSERFFLDVVQAARDGNEVVIETLRPLLTAYWPSQLFQAITDGPILLLALVLAWWRPRKPGVVGSVFLVVYGVLRVASERFRQPDEGVALLLGLSRGQVLSVLMIAVGLACLVVTTRRDVERLGGLVRVAPPRGT